MHARKLLRAVVTAVLAVLSLTLFALPASAAEDPGAGASQAQCIAPDGTLLPAPAGKSGGAPEPCPVEEPATQEVPTPPTPPPAADAPPAEPAPATPAPAPEPVATPKTEAPAGGTAEPQDVQSGTENPKAHSKPEKRKNTKKHRRHGSPGGGTTGPDDTNPPPPPASLLDSPASSSPGSGSGGGVATGGNPFAGGPPIVVTRGVPNLLLDQFRVPPFLLPIYQAAGVEYGIRWEVLAAINSIETDYGRNLSVSTAGAVGWMQFMPETWATYGVDANRDGRRDPYNPVDAIFAAARYLKAAGAGDSIQKAIFSYNHAQWYVDDVLRRARALSALPPEVIGSLSGLTLGRFPVAGTTTYAGRLDTHAKLGRVRSGSASISVGSSATRRGMNIYARAGAPVVAVQDARVVAVGMTRRLGRYIRIRDAYGNTYTYAHLAKVANLHPVPKPRSESEAQIRHELGLDRKDPKPTLAASAGKHTSTSATLASSGDAAAPVIDQPAPLHPGTTPALTTATPATQTAQVTPVSSAFNSGVTATPDMGLQTASQSDGRPPLYQRLRAYARIAMAKIDAAAPTVDASSIHTYFAQRPIGVKDGDYVLKPLRVGSKIIAGTILGRIGAASLKASSTDDPAQSSAAKAAAKRLHVARAPHVYFEIRPAGKKSPRIDPKPILDGWRLLDETAIYRARNPIVRTAATAKKLTIGQIMLMSKDQLQRHVLDNPNIQIYECGRQDIRAGIIDRRVLASLEFLVSRGMNPTVTSLNCGHGFLTSSGNVSEHSTGDAVDVAAINGIPINGHQGEGSITDKAVRQLITLQGTMKPHQIITLMQYKGVDNTLALADHYDHIHIGFHPEYVETSALKPSQWDRLINGLESIRNPRIVGAGEVAAAARKRAAAHSATRMPSAVGAAFAAGDLIADLPYRWGGGHDSFQDNAYDCSGSVSWVLHGAGLLDQPLTSGDLERYGEPGPGRWITIYANAAHTWMVIGGWRYDTGNLPATGTRWSDAPRSTKGFVVRHPPGL